MIQNAAVLFPCHVTIRVTRSLCCNSQNYVAILRIPRYKIPSKLLVCWKFRIVRLVVLSKDYFQILASKGLFIFY